MSAEKILPLLEKVRKTGKDKWSASCPAHDDKGPSLAIKVAEDGVVLIHCFAGCGACEVLDALNLTFEDLFPERAIAGQFCKPARRPFNAFDVLSGLAFEVLVVLQLAKIAASGRLSREEMARLLKAASRMQAGLDMVNG